MAATTAACTAILDLNEPPAGPTDASTRVDGTVSDGMAADGATGEDGTAPDATASDGAPQHDGTVSDGTAGDASARDASKGDGPVKDSTIGDVERTETGIDAADAGKVRDASGDVFDGFVPLQGTAVAAGASLSCAIVVSGSVVCWGDNSHGQLGNGTTLNSSVPVGVVGGLTHVSQVAVGQYHACALQSGLVSCWGYNSSGQLGNNSTTASNVPVSVALSASATAISVAFGHSCALLSTGGVECWGDNTDGDLGNGVTTQSLVPVPVSAVAGTGTGPLLNAVAIAAGSAHTCAGLQGGSVACWGSNANGQLGAGTANSAVPVIATGVQAVASIAAGNAHTCAVVGVNEAGAGGQVKCWGSNAAGQLGNGSLAGSGPVLAAISGAGASKVSCGTGFTCALISDGTVECFGQNPYGELGNPPLAQSQPTPKGVAGISHATAIAAGDEHACAVGSGGTIQCWGSNAYGQIGSFAPTSYAPETTPEISSVKSLGIANTGMHACAIFGDGGVECWGNNPDSELGNGTNIPASAPVAVAGVTGAMAVTVGADHTCALFAGGNVKCWGDNGSGQIGDTSFAAAPTPVAVSNLTSATQIGAGQGYVCALLVGGTVECWGSDAQDELGNGSTTNVDSPALVPGLSGVKQIATGSQHACALTGSGGVSCWGNNSSGQLGVSLDGGATTSSKAVSVPGISGATRLAAGAFHTCAISAGNVSCWGTNPAGQLGNNTMTSVSTPTPVMGLTGTATALSAGASHTCAIVTEGTTTGIVECWGSNQYGQLATGAPYGQLALTAVRVGVTGAHQIYAGLNMTCAVLSGGTATCWGSDADGQLGIGAPFQSSTPIAVQLQ